MRNHFALFVQVVVLDLRSGNQSRSVEHEIGRQFFFAHLGQMRCVRTIITTYDQQQVHWHIEQFAQRILSLLRCAADRVEKPKILLGEVGPVSIDNRPSNAPLHFFGFPTQHGGLICHANGLQMHVGIEPRWIGPFELLEERLFVTTVPDVIANVIGVRECQNDQVMPAAVTESARAGGLCFFVFSLPVNDRSGRFARVLAHSLPDAHHVSTRGVDNLAAAILDLLLNR